MADQDGLFRYAGQRLGRAARSGWLLFAGATVMIAAVTVTLNLDTSVAFLTPVLVYTARSRGGTEPPEAGAEADADARAAGAGAGAGGAGARLEGAGPALLYGCLLLSNAASLLLPGSNLTNLIVLGHLRLTGGQFVSRMWLPWLGAVIVTAVVVAAGERRSLRPAPPGGPAGAPQRPVLGAGLAAVVLATATVVALPDPAIPVLVLGVAAAGLRLARRQVTLRQVRDVLSLPVLAGLFAVAVILGTLGRTWSGPSVLMAQLGSWATAGVAALATVALNNLPGRLPAGGPGGEPSVRAAGRPESRAEPVRHRLAGLAAVAAGRPRGGRPPVAAPGQHPRAGRGAGLDGGRPVRADPDRRGLTGAA